MRLYLYRKDQQEGPYTEDQLRDLVKYGGIKETEYAWHEGLSDWQPLNEIISFKEASAVPPPFIKKQSTLIESTPQPVVETNVKQGAIVGGWITFILGTAIMHFSLWAFVIYIPLFLVAFILSITAMAQRRIAGGIILLLITLIVPPVQWFITAAKRTDEYMETHLPPEQRLAWNVGKELAQQAEEKKHDQEATENNETNSTPTPESITPVPTPEPSEADKVESAFLQLTESSSPVELTGATAPVIYEIKANEPASSETIAQYILGYYYRDKMDEFAKREFIQKLNSTIHERKVEAKPDNLYSVVDEMASLYEYDFQRNGFPIKNNIGDAGPYKYLTVPHEADGALNSFCFYRVWFTNASALQFIPVALEDAEALAPALRKSRQAKIMYTGYLDRCEQEVEGGGGASGPAYTTKIIYLTVSEVKMSAEGWGSVITYKVPGIYSYKSSKDSQSTSFQPFAQTSKTRLSPDDISNYDLQQVQEAINEIYGRYGVEFPKKSNQEWANHQSWYHRIPGRTPDIAEQMFTTDEKANIETLAAHRNALRTGNASYSNQQATPSFDSSSSVPTAPTVPMETQPSGTTAGPNIDTIPILSPENVVASILNTNLQIMAASFRSQYSGRTVRYTGTVVRKNSKEELVVFKGGGFLTTAYDVQANLRDGSKPGFSDVSIGDRVTIVATLDRLVTPPFGVGSNSIRLNDGQVYRKSR